MVGYPMIKKYSSFWRRMLAKSVILFVFAQVVCAQQIPQTSVGAISGTLQGEDGSPIIGASVTLLRLPPYPKGRWPRIEWTTKSAGGGAFSFTAIDSGRYRLCAQAPSTTWLNPCEWGLNAEVVALSQTQRSIKISMIMKKGTAVPIRIDDPGQLLSLHEGKTPDAHLLLGVSNDTFGFRIASIISSDAGGRNHQVIIPFDKSVNIVANSLFFKLADSGGRLLNSNASSVTQVNVPAGKKADILRFVVTGAGK